MLLAASGYLFIGPENLAALSGAMKEMFDRCYYPCLGKLEGRPYATIICAGSDGENAQRQLDRIATGWRLKRVAEAYDREHRRADAGGDPRAQDDSRRPPRRSARSGCGARPRDSRPGSSSMAILPGTGGGPSKMVEGHRRLTRGLRSRAPPPPCGLAGKQRAPRAPLLAARSPPPLGEDRRKPPTVAIGAPTIARYRHPMLRLTELNLPLHHAPEALPAAICKRLRITPRDLVRHVVARRAHDARDKTDIQLVYSIDVNLKDEARGARAVPQGPQCPADARSPAINSSRRRRPGVSGRS